MKESGLNPPVRQSALKGKPSTMAWELSSFEGENIMPCRATLNRFLNGTRQRVMNVYDGVMMSVHYKTLSESLCQWICTTVTRRTLCRLSDGFSTAYYVYIFCATVNVLRLYFL